MSNGETKHDSRTDKPVNPPAKTATGAVDIYSVTSIDGIHATLSALHARDAAVTAQLDALVASQKTLSRDLGRLDVLRAHLGAQTSTARAIGHGTLSEAAATAARISGAVRRLDVQQARVRATLAMVEQVAELRACVLGVAGSMGASQDWETAAGYLARAARVPRAVVDGAFASQAVPTTEVPDAPAVTLDAAAESLCGLFLREFDRAAAEGDGGKVTRFFKLFPLIGRADVGLEVYGRYVCTGVATRARASMKAGTGGTLARDDPLFYAAALTRLFEHIAQIVDGHGELVERHYGAGSMARVAMRLQAEADVQGGIILESWSDERRVDRRLTDIKAYAFTFLVQSFLPPSNGRPRDAPVDDEGVDMKEVDALLSEMAVMLARWSLYCRFLADKCEVCVCVCLASKGKGGEEEDPLTDEQSPTMPPFLAQSALAQKMGERLIGPFNTMTTFFLRRSVEKAFQLDEQPAELNLNIRRPLPASASPPFISSAVDDIMYIVNRVARQSLETAQVTVATSATLTLNRVLGSEFIGMIQRKMRDEHYPRAAVAGGAPAETTVIAFLVLINNLDVAVDYVGRIVGGLVGAPAGEDGREGVAADKADKVGRLFPVETDAAAVRAALASFQASFESKANDLLADGTQVVYNHVVKGRLRPLLADAFCDADYQPGSGRDSGDSGDGGYGDEYDDGGSETGEEASVRARFEHGWTDTMAPLARVLTARAFERLLATALAALARLLEKRVWAYSGRVNSLGATRLEGDVRGLVAAAVSVAAPGGGGGGGAGGAGGGGAAAASAGAAAGAAGAAAAGGGLAMGEAILRDEYKLRGAFARCVQIAVVMGLEEEEWLEAQAEDGGAGMAPQLGADERARARAAVSS